VVTLYTMNEAKLQTRTVSADEADIRLDRWFRRHFPAVTQGQLQKLLRTGQVRVDGKRAEASLRLAEGQAVRVPPQAIRALEVTRVEQSSRDTERLKKLILFEDDDVIVINKPAGLAVQGGSGLKENLDDMLEGLSHRKHGKPKLVHRLDRDTSGVLLIARSRFAAAKLSEAFRERDTQKIYWGVTLGVPKPGRGRIDAALVRKGEIMVAAKDDDEEAKSAATLYQTIESAAKQAAFVAMWPLTGRTHQLRAHMALIGTPLIGDRLYGRAAESLATATLGQGLHLHARRLVIPHPRRGVIDVMAPLGAEMQKTWKWFGFDSKADVDFDEG
jgi:23S rRNA pseudouridine955/2504/2580 synthase